MSENRRRAAAICMECGNALAVQVCPDGSVRPIGTGTNCSCGSDAFQVLESSGFPDGDEKRSRHEA
ncbi:hypothetical protein [Natronobacterium texcoconense]|uniref:Uncharacterized protein n=1 Tax=Natronobacterium texcoconense TaxID=1095778 RepID=A0A1H1J4T8_NATTX|nr:hypothetical protein [Natronobacterium texcoconense]SDR44962.1 hypothetical protein SAMN04489842_4135 [Natronobacterium texcoconense]